MVLPGVGPNKRRHYERQRIVFLSSATTAKDSEFFFFYFNNYLTIGKIAEHHGISEDEALAKIDRGKLEHERNVSMKKKYKVTPYFGRDCNSHDGFNNGLWIAYYTVEADSPEDASTKAMAKYIEEHPDVAEHFKDDSHMGDWVLYSEFGHNDGEGNEIKPEDFDGDNDSHGYLYQYIDFGQSVEVIKEEI